MYDIGGLKLDDLPKGGQVIAYGDFDNNKLWGIVFNYWAYKFSTDIVLLDDNSRELTVLIYSHGIS